MRENRASHLVGWKTDPTIAPVGVRTHDLPHTVASNIRPYPLGHGGGIDSHSENWDTAKPKAK